MAPASIARCSAQISRPYPRPFRPGRPPRSTVRGPSALSRRPHRASAFDGLVNSIQRCQHADIASTDTDPTRLAVLLWTALHGQASLRMNGPDFPWPPLENMITELVIRLTSLRAEA
ncbi:MAG: TetR-like C-terminal domain-containing protein [Solirubrobacteraceae bacterium]